MIILINGSINSGKTTVSRLLVQKLERTAHIEVDSLREFIRFMPLKESIPTNLQNAGLVASNLLKKGINVVISYPLSKQNLDYLLEHIEKLDQEVFFFTLNPDLESITQNRGDRELDAEEVDRIRVQYGKGINKPDFGVVLDTTNMTAGKTADTIVGMLVSANVLCRH
jgi:uridine kinase